MTTATMAQSIRTTTAQPRPSLEELVDRVIAALFKEETEQQAPATTATQSVARSVHEEQPRPSLEELVDRVIAALFKEETEPQAPGNYGDAERRTYRSRRASHTEGG